MQVTPRSDFPAADAGGFNRTRADDLIVQLIHMLRNAEPFFDDEDEEDR